MPRRKKDSVAGSAWEGWVDFLNGRIGEGKFRLEVEAGAEQAYQKQIEDWETMSTAERIALVQSKNVELPFLFKGLESDSKALRAASLNSLKQFNQWLLRVAAKSAFPDQGITSETSYIELLKIIDHHHPEWGVTVYTNQSDLVKKMLEKMGQQMKKNARRKRPGPPSTVSSAAVQQAVRNLGNKAKQTEVAAAVGVSDRTLLTWLKREGFRNWKTVVREFNNPKG